ncbi:MAG: transporter substrate-binding domain-containing protein [Trichodesmium erythraeum GBRTRLIN201]|nr:transporter substrate-binding domain-containing protein [Trichodesmium erythraeum GBRTRLIN201]
MGKVNIQASNQGFGITYLDNVVLDVNNIVGMISDNDFLKDAANTVTETFLGDGDPATEGTQLVLAQPGIEFEKKNNTKKLSFAGDFNGEVFDLSFDVSEIGSKVSGAQKKIPKLSGFKFGLPELDATKMTNAFKTIAGTELPGFAQDLLTTLGGLANLNIELNDNGFGVTYVGGLNISSTINSLLSTLGLGENVLSDSLSVTNPGLRVTKDDTGKKIYAASIGEFSPTEAIEFLGDTLGVELPNNIQEQLNKVGKVNIQASNQGFGITYLDNVVLDVNNIVGMISDNDFLKDAANTVTETFLGDGDPATEGTQLVLAQPGIEFEKKNNTKKLSFAGDFNGEVFDLSFDVSEIGSKVSGAQKKIPKLSGFKFGLPELDATKMTNAFKTIAGTELPGFAQDLLTTLGGLANLNIELNDNGFGVTYVGELNISSTINSLLSTLGLGENVMSQSLTVSHPGLRYATDETGNRNYELSVSEFSPKQLINLLVGLLPSSVSLPSNIRDTINSIGNASLSLSSQGISITYLDNVTFDLNGLIGDSFNSLSFVEDAVNKIAEIVLGDGDKNKPGTQLVLAKPEFELTTESLGIGGLLNDKNFDIDFKDGLEFEYEFGPLNLNSILGDIPGLDGFQLDETSLSFSDGFSLEGNVNFANKNDDVSKFINDYLGVDNVGVALEIGKEDLSLAGILAGDVPLISIGDFKATLKDVALGLEMSATNPIPNFGIDGGMTLEGYDPVQKNEPPLTLIGGLEIDPKSLTGQFNIDADGVWKNPFGLPDSELRELGVQIGATYIPPFIDNVGFVGDLQFGNYDFDAAFLVDITDPQKFAIELTLNEPLGLVDMITGPINSYLINQLDNVPILDEVTGLFNSFSDLVPISVVSIDGPDDDEELDPLIKIVPVETEVLERTLEQGIGFNAAVRVGSKEGTFNFNMNPFSGNPSLEGSLKIPEIDILGVVKISGVPNGKDTDLNLDLKVSPSEAYFRGDGQLEFFGINLAKADFDFSTSGIKVKELSLLNGTLKLSDVEIGKLNNVATAKGELEFLGQKLKAEITQDGQGFKLTTGLVLDFPDWTFLSDTYANLTIRSNGTLEGSQLELDSPLFNFEVSLGEIKNGIGDLVNFAINEVNKLGEQVADFIAQEWNNTVEYVSDTFKSLGNAWNQGISLVSNIFETGVRQVVDWVDKQVQDGWLPWPLDHIVKWVTKTVRQVTNIEYTKNDPNLPQNVSLGDGNQEYDGQGGNDTIDGGNGKDHLMGGVGNDSLKGGNDEDKLEGGAGHDYLHGQRDNDFLYGNDHDDRLYGEDGNDMLDGGSGNDQLYGGNGRDQLKGGSGNDKLYGEDKSDVLEGGMGNDELHGGNDNDVLKGESGKDTLRGGSGSDKLEGGEDHDHLYGESDSDKLEGGQGDDYLNGGDGNDEIDGGKGNDSLVGDQGDDILYGREGNDTLKGDSGNDLIFGGVGNDILYGGTGDDYLDGGEGNDTIYPGSGNDTINGGEGNDLLVLSGAKSDYIITDTSTGKEITNKRDNSKKIVFGIENISYEQIQQGNASNGPLANATVFIDTNSNFQLDKGETQTNTDSNGEYSLPFDLEELDRNGDGEVDAQEAQVVVIGGIDTNTGLPGEIPLISQISATGEYTSTTPLTTLKAVLSSQGIKEKQVERLLNKISGFSLESLSQPLEKFDPYSAIGEGDDSGIEITSGHIKIMNLLLNGTTFLEAAYYTESDGQIQVINALGKVLKTVESFDLSKKQDLQKFYNQLTEELDLSVNNKTIAALSTLVTQSNNLIDKLVEQALSSSVDDVLPSINPIKKQVYSILPDLTQQLVEGKITAGEAQTELKEILNADTFLVEHALNEDRIVKVVASDTVKEGKDKNGQFIITLGEAAPPQGLKILYTISGTATLGQDYQNKDGLFGEINFEPGETEAVIDLKVLDDKISENSESVTINLKYVGNGYALDPMAKTAFLEITDNDKGNNNATKNGIEETGSFGDDEIAGQEKNDKLLGSYGDDMLKGKGGDDKLMGGQGKDTIQGGKGNDEIEGNFGEDVLEGNAGDDVIAGGSEDDLIKGGPGNDFLDGNTGDDQLEGNSGNDQLEGGKGNDILKGNRDNDWLVGEAGEDILNGGPGVDLLRGGEGADVFYFQKPSDKGDLIIDFDPTQGDKIQISRSGFKTNSLEDFKVVVGTLEFKGEEIALIQNNGKTYNNFAELADIVELVDEPKVKTTPEKSKASIEIKPQEAKLNSVANPETTILDDIIKRGQIKVAISGSGNEFDLEFAEVIAAAVFGDASKVKSITSKFSKSFELVADGKADLAAQRITATLGRDGELNVDFAPTYLFDYQTVIVPNDSDITNVSHLNEQTIGVIEGTTALINLQNQLEVEGIKFTPKLFETAEEMIAAYDAGEVDAYSHDRSLILENLDQLSQPENHRLLDVELSKEPISLALPENDSQWADVVRWAGYVPIQAEEFGISSQNIAEFIALNTDDNPTNDSSLGIRRFLGIEGNLGETLGLPNDFAVNIINQVGNYSEIYDRHFSGIEGDRNSLWSDGGFLYSPPFSGSEIDIVIKDNDDRDLLAKIKERGVLKLGLPDNEPGFAVKMSNGEYEGFDVDLGKAIAAAIFGDPEKLEVKTQSFKDSFANTANGVVDISAMGITHNLVRDASLGIDFGPIYLYTGQGVLVRNDSGITVLPALNGRRVGVLEGATSLQNIQDTITELGGDIIPAEFTTNDEMFAAYDDGDIDAVITDMTILNGRVQNLSNPKEHKILDDILSKEPLGLIIDENQSEWSDVVRWVTNALVQAEEYDITSKNIKRLMANNLDDDPNNDSDPVVRQFLGIEGNIGKVLGLPNDFVPNVIKAVGNYGEIYERYFDSNLLPREQNELFSNFGLQYALPLGSEVSPTEQEELGSEDDVYEIQPSTLEDYPDGFQAKGGNDRVTGSMRSDLISGGQGQDTISGNDGDDRIIGGPGVDYLYGKDGNDLLEGRTENDYLFGGPGNDALIGGQGRDKLNGGQGSDFLIGGASKDKFIFATNEEFDVEAIGSDTIDDFNPDDDIILLDKKTFTALESKSGEGFSLETEFASVTKNVATSEALIVYNSNNGKLFYNENGNEPGFGEGGEFALLTDQPAIGADDFLIR